MASKCLLIFTFLLPGRKPCKILGLVPRSTSYSLRPLAIAPRRHQSRRERGGVIIGEESARTVAEAVSKTKDKKQRSRTHAFMFQPLYFCPRKCQIRRCDRAQVPNLSRAWILPVSLLNTPYLQTLRFADKQAHNFKPSKPHLPLSLAAAALLVVRLPVAGATVGALSGSVVGGSTRGVRLRLAAGFALLLGASG